MYYAVIGCEQTHVCRLVLDLDGRVDSVHSALVLIPQLLEGRQTTVQTERRVGRDGRARAVRRHRQRVCLVPLPEGLLGLRRNGIDLRTRPQGELELAEGCRRLERVCIARSTAYDETTEVVCEEVRLSASNGIIEVKRGIPADVRTKSDVEGRRETQGSRALCEGLGKRPEGRRTGDKRGGDENRTVQHAGINLAFRTRDSRGVAFESLLVGRDEIVPRVSSCLPMQYGLYLKRTLPT